MFSRPLHQSGSHQSGETSRFSGWSAPPHLALHMMEPLAIQALRAGVGIGGGRGLGVSHPPTYAEA